MPGDMLLTQYIYYSLGARLVPGVIIFLARDVVWVLGIGSAVWVLAHERDRIKKLFRQIIVSVAAAVAVNSLIGLAYFRLRPFVTAGFEPLISISTAQKSFPSDHAAILFAFAVSMFLYSRTAGTIAIVLAVAGSLGRVLAGVHFFSDIVAGAAIGSLSAFVVWKCIIPASAWVRQRRRRKS